MGGKAAIASEIATYLTQIRKPGQLYIEPFCGACSVLCKMADPRQASDAQPDLILLWNALQLGWLPPRKVPETKYYQLRHSRPSDLRAFAGFACSYGAKFFAGYARSKKYPQGYAEEGRRGCLRKIALLQNVPFHQGDYRDLNPTDALIYCDPPYLGTQGFHGVAPFDHEIFWDTMRHWSKSNAVVISEAQAPDDFVAVMTLRARRGIRKGPKARKGMPARIEFLFRHRSQL
jgi:DNA adenine methylase